MALNPRSRRIFGGKNDTSAAAAGQRYSRELLNEADQTQAETLPVGTVRRLFPGPKSGGTGYWSYHINNLSASGATSTLKFYYSDLPAPDPANAAHWKDSGITAIDLTAVAVSFATKTTDFPAWIMAEAIAVTSGGTLWGYVKTDGVDGH